MSADAGIVNIHAQTMRPATPHRTAESLLVAPTPTMAPVMVCVVLTGIPKIETPISVAAPAVSALKPPGGLSLVILIPIVCTIRQPPAKVPPAIAAWQVTITQNGKASYLPGLRKINSIQMTPMVF